MRSLTLTFLALSLVSTGALAQQLGDPNCDQLLLVSSYTGNNVKIYDGCDYQFIRDLDDNGRLAGPQAIALDPNGNLVVASENNNRLVRYLRSDLSYDAVIAGDKPETGTVESAPVNKPTGLVISPEGRVFAGSYTDDRVTEIDPQTGQALNDYVTFADSGIRGPDTGMILDGDRLLVPGFDSSSVVVADINQPGSSRVLVTAGAGGVDAPRTVLREDDGDLLVTSWRGGQVLEYNGSNGNFKRVVSAGVQRPTGMAFESDEVLLVASDSLNNIVRVRISDGQVLGSVVSFGNGGLQAPTFVMVLDKIVPRIAQSRAFWLIGVGEIQDGGIFVDEMSFTTGGEFGDGFDPANIDAWPWGSVDIRFDECGAGHVDFLPLETNFDAGDYALQRLAADPGGAECEELGFQNIDHNRWMSGIWYGGSSRSGEGFSINVINDDRAIVTWYTYLP